MNVWEKQNFNGFTYFLESNGMDSLNNNAICCVKRLSEHI